MERGISKSSASFVTAKRAERPPAISCSEMRKIRGAVVREEIRLKDRILVDAFGTDGNFR